MSEMERKYYTYGIKGSSLDETAPRIAKALNIQFRERASDFYAGTYYSYRTQPGGEVKLYNNYDPVLGEWVQEHFREYDLILEVSKMENMNHIHQKLSETISKVVLLESDVMTSESPEDLDDEE